VATQTEKWTAALHHRIANALKDARQGRYTAQQLADACEQCGYPISRSQIANYESGRKQTLDVAELLVLAAALGVPPIALLFPNLPDGDAEALPGWHTTAANALRWFTGEHTPDDDGDVEPADEAKLVRLTRRRCDMEDRQERIQGTIDLLQLAGTKREKQQAAHDVLALTNMGEDIADLNRQIAAIPGAVVTKHEGKQR
jgi:transcriptional regulator with XRE-family HTH domain